jgi:ABC-type uncharacterized transport system auxiliary subunit
MKLLILAFLIFIIGFQSCGERALIRHYYVMELPAKGDFENLSSVSVEGLCEILDTNIPPAYSQTRIAVRKKSHEISYYQYHYWAMNPSENLTSLLEHQLQMSQIFTSSKSGFLKQIPDYQISAQVYKLEALDNGDVFYAHLEMRMELIEYEGTKTVVTHQFERTKDLQNRDLNLFAAELSIIFQEEVHNFIKKIRAYFDNNQSIPTQKD